MLRQMSVILCMSLTLGAGGFAGPLPEDAVFPKTERIAAAMERFRAEHSSVPEEDASQAEPVSFKECGRMRLTYTGGRHSVSYVDSPEELPYDLRTEGYDEDFFSEHALLVVVETVNSGSVRIGIESAVREDDTVAVTLSHEVPEYGTDDMATWMLWAEVESGLGDCEWELVNPALPSEMELK